LGCLPLWGREGVTLIAAAENYRMAGKEVFNRSENGTSTSRKKSGDFYYRAKIRWQIKRELIPLHNEQTPSKEI
jgi:hypothetical protein